MEDSVILETRASRKRTSWVVL